MGYGTQIRAVFGVQDSAWVILGWGKCISFLISHPPVRSATPFSVSLLVRLSVPPAHILPLPKIVLGLYLEGSAQAYQTCGALRDTTQGYSPVIGPYSTFQPVPRGILDLQPRHFPSSPSVLVSLLVLTSILSLHTHVHTYILTHKPNFSHT